MACGSCGQRRNNVVKFEVHNSAGKVVGTYPTRAEAEAKRVQEGAGASVKPKTAQPGPATNSTAP